MRFLTSLKDFFVEFLRFVLKPNENINSTRLTIKSLLQIFVFTILLVFLIWLGSYLLRLTPLQMPNRSDYALLSRLQTIPHVLIFFVGAIIAPFLEELSFRLPLKPSLKNALISLISLSVAQMFFTRQSFSVLYFDHTINFELARLLAVIISFSFIIIYLFIKRATNDRHYWFFFYVMAFLFTVFHDISNINSISDIFASFIFWFHAFILALWTGFLRLKFGVFSSIISHVQYNATIIILSALLSR